MRINSINSVSKCIFRHSELSQSTPIKNENADLITYMENKDKKNQQRALVVGGVIALASLGIIALTPKLGKKTTKKVTSAAVPSGFWSLKNESDVPTLETCKSINKKLKDFLQYQVDLLKATPEDIKNTGNPTVSNRLLLYGAPGSGKTYFAKIFAKSLDADYKEIKYSELNDEFVGAHLENIKACFEDIIKNAQANPNKRFVVTFNEIDSMMLPIGRLTKSGGHSVFKVEERSVFLNYLDEVAEKAPNVTIIGTTNVSLKNHGLDAAAISRFKNKMEVSYPDKECLSEALKANLKELADGEKFISENKENLDKLVKNMADRKCSYRDLNEVVDSSKRLYLKDYLKDKNAKYKYEYLERAMKEIDLTDGEVSGTV